MKKNLFVLEVIIILGTAFILKYFNIRFCPFYNILKIPCPGCGLTRSITSLAKLDLISSIKYNILGIPIVFITCFYIFFSIIKKDYLITNFLKKYKYIIITICVMILIAVEIININNSLLY